MPPGTSAAVGGMGFSAAMASGVAPAARDMQQTPAPTGLMAGKQDGNNAAYDMKSLGKHIEAVCLNCIQRRRNPSADSLAF